MKGMIFGERTSFRLGDEHGTVANIRTFLDRLGYMSLAQMVVAPDRAVFDANLEQAVKKYQGFHGLEPTGTIDQETRRVMEMPRCGVPDLLMGQEAHPPGVAMFVLSGGKWPSYGITYRFVSGTGDLAGDTERGIVRQAFDVWAGVTDLEFTEMTAASEADILLSWVTGDHGDGSPFDGPGHVLAHAFFPPPINPHPGIAGDMHFDDAETWSDTGAGGTIDLLTVAIHELGHALGLRHTNDPNAIMFPTYSGPNHTLGSDDIAGIRKTYPPLPWWVHLLRRIWKPFGRRYTRI